MESYENWLNKRRLRRTAPKLDDLDDSVSIASGTTVSKRGIGLSEVVKRVTYLEETIKKLADQVAKLADTMGQVSLLFPGQQDGNLPSKAYEIGGSSISEAP